MSLRIEFTGGPTVEFGVTSIPRRKNKALYIMRGCQAEVVAYFRSNDDADRFERALGIVVDSLQEHLDHGRLTPTGDDGLR